MLRKVMGRKINILYRIFGWRDLRKYLRDTHLHCLVFWCVFFPHPSTFNNVYQVICESGTYNVSVV